MKIIKRDFGFGGSRLDNFSSNNLRELLVQIILELEKTRAAYNSHTHGGAVGVPTIQIAPLEIQEEK